jgi:hypothetical protein
MTDTIDRKCKCGHWTGATPEDFKLSGLGSDKPAGIDCSGCGKRIPVPFASLPPTWITLIYDRKKELK